MLKDGTLENVLVKNGGAIVKVWKGGIIMGSVF